MDTSLGKIALPAATVRVFRDEFDFAADVSPIKGWLTRAEATFLFEAAKRIDPRSTIVEIGSFKGRSTICLAKGSLAGSRPRVVAIDPHHGNPEHQRQFGRVDTFDEFRQNLLSARVTHAVIALKDTSVRVAARFDRRVSLLFIDGDHSFAAVRQDLRSWLPLVDAGGVVAVHDSWQIWGPHIVTAWALCTSRQIRNARLVDTMTVFEKSTQNSLLDRMRNRAFVVFRLFWGLKGFVNLKLLGSRVR
jgi:predicted O-methyltransferase YrrM